MPLRMLGVLLLGLLFPFAASGAEEGALEGTVWQALKTPGAVVVLRHSYAPGSFDPPDSRIDDCATQRNLDAEGKAQAKAVGEAFRANGIVVGEVLSSPKCRTRDTALIAFGRVQNWDALMGAFGKPALARQKVDMIHARMGAHRGDRPMVLVTHGSIVRALLGTIIPMGEFAVLLPEADGSGYRLAGRLFVR